MWANRVGPTCPHYAKFTVNLIFLEISKIMLKGFARYVC